MVNQKLINKFLGSSFLKLQPKIWFFKPEQKRDQTKESDFHRPKLKQIPLIKTISAVQFVIR